MLLHARIPVLAILVGLNTVSISPDNAVHAVAIQSRQLGSGRTAEVAVAPGEGDPGSGNGQLPGQEMNRPNKQQQAVQSGSSQVQSNEEYENWPHSCNQHQVRAIDLVPSNPFVGIADALFTQFVFQWPGKGDGPASGNPSSSGSSSNPDSNTNTPSSSFNSAKTSNLNSPAWQQPIRRSSREPSSEGSKKNGKAIVISDRRGTSYIVPHEKGHASKRGLDQMHYARMYPGGGRLSRSQARKSGHPYNKRQVASQAFRRTLDGIPGKVAITSGSPNSTEKIIAWLAMSPNDDKDSGKGDPTAPYVLNASDTNRTEFYMQNVPPSWSPGPIPQGPDQPAPVRLAIDGTSYCATFDPNPQSAQPLTVKDCFSGPNEGMPHQSQIFMYDGKTGEVKPVWASQDQGSSDGSSASAAEGPSSSNSPSTPSASGGSLSARQDPPPPPPPGATPLPTPTDGSSPPANPSDTNAPPPASPPEASAQGDASAPPPNGPAPPAPPAGGPAPPSPPAGVPALPVALPSPPSPPGPPSPPAPPSAMSADKGSSSDPASPEPTQTVTLLFVRDDGKGPGAALQKSSDSAQSAAMASDPNFSSGVSSSAGAVPTPSGQAFAAEETATVTRTVTVYGTPSPSTGMNAQGDGGLPANPSGSSVGAQGVPTSSADPSGSGIGAQGVPTSAGPSGSGIGAQAVSTSSSSYADPSGSNVGAQAIPTSSADPSGLGVGAQGVPTSSVDPSRSSVVGAQDTPTSSPVDSSASSIGAQGVPTPSSSDPTFADAASTSSVQSPSSIGAQSAPPYTSTSVIGSSMTDAAYTSPADSQSLSPSASPSSAGLNAMSDSPPQGTGNSGASSTIVTASTASGPNVEMFGTSTSPSSQYGARTAAPSSSSDASAIAASIAASMRSTASGGSAEAAAAENTYVAAVMRRRRSPRSRRAARSAVTGQAKGMKGTHWESDPSVTDPYRWKFV